MPDICGVGRRRNKVKMKQNLPSNFQKALTQPPSWSSLSAFIYGLLLTVCGIYRRTKDQRITFCFYSGRKNSYFIGMSVGLAPEITKTHDVMVWNGIKGELKVTPASLVYFLILQRQRIIVWMDLLPIQDVQSCFFVAHRQSVYYLWWSPDHQRTTRFRSRPTDAWWTSVFCRFKTLQLLLHGSCHWFPVFPSFSHIYAPNFIFLSQPSVCFALSEAS